jgi:hypothetical protein
MHQFTNSKTCDKRRQHRIVPFFPLKRTRVKSVKLTVEDGLDRDGERRMAKGRIIHWWA